MTPPVSKEEIQYPKPQTGIEHERSLAGILYRQIHNEPADTDLPDALALLAAVRVACADTTLIDDDGNRVVETDRILAILNTGSLHN